MHAVLCYRWSHIFSVSSVKRGKEYIRFSNISNLPDTVLIPVQDFVELKVGGPILQYSTCRPWLMSWLGFLCRESSRGLTFYLQQRRDQNTLTFWIQATPRTCIGPSPQFILIQVNLVVHTKTVTERGPSTQFSNVTCSISLELYQFVARIGFIASIDIVGSGLVVRASFCLIDVLSTICC